MSTRGAYLWSLFLAGASLVSGLYYYTRLPAQMVSHWGMSGVPDSSVPTFWGVVSIPLVCAGLVGLFILIPRIDPLGHNIALFRRQYNLFLVSIVIALVLIQGAIIAFNLGFNFNISNVVLPVLGVLFFIIGMLLPYTKRNWFVGIPTPWTVHSDTAWQKTHRAGGILFRFLGVLAILEVFLPPEYADYMVFIFIFPLVAALAGLVVYSFIAFRTAEGPAQLAEEDAWPL